jgi:CHAD domain-containing protein
MSDALQYGLFRKRLDAFACELAGVEEGNVEAVHRARVATRRLRELFPLLELDRETTQELRRRLRKVTKQLGTVRELDVLLRLIEERHPDSPGSQAAWQWVSAAVARARVAARQDLAARCPTAKLERLADRLERAGKHLESKGTTSFRRRRSGSTRTWLWALDAQLARRAANARSAIEAASALYVPERLHDVRIALKKLRYTAELSKEAGRRHVTADIAALKKTQDLLGRLRDLETLLAWGRNVQASGSPPDLTGWRELGALVRAIEDDCRPLHARYVRDRATLSAIAVRLGAGRAPAAFVGRLAV